MTSVEYAQHCLRASVIADLVDAPLSDLHEMAVALSTALLEFFALAPAIWSRTTVSHLLHPPETLTVQALADTNSLGGAPFFSAQRGCTVWIDGDTKPNEVTGLMTLLHDYDGPTGEHDATLFYDAVPILDFAVHRITSDVTVIHPDGRRRHLVQLGSRPEGNDTKATGTPTHYWLEPIGGSRQVALDGVFQLRLWPMPSASVTVTFDADIAPLPITVADFTSPRVIPVPDAEALRLLIPLARQIVADSLIGRDMEGHRRNGIDKSASSARDGISLLPTVWTYPVNDGVGTPEGW